MNTRKKFFQHKLILGTAIVLLVVLVSIVAASQHSVSAAGTGPCDIYASGGTPCVAAHSTVRALYGAYNGRLYQVRRASNGNTLDIGTLSAGGFANSAAQDSFCAGTTCTISVIYDQSGRGNHLTKAPPGGFLTNGGLEANATAARIQVGGNWVYGIYTTMSWDNAAGSVGYRDNTTSGVATGDQPEGIYMVASGTRYNEWCCFDYGNADPSNTAAGPGTMEAVYFGNSTQWGHGAGSGPWVMADLEFGLFAGGALVNNNNTPIIANYITGMVKGNSGNLYAIKGGSAQSGSLTTMYNGPRPSGGYNPMRKGGSIVLGIGGDNSHTGEGTFFEGAMTSGYPSDAIENAVQANIVAAGYGSSSGGPTPTRTSTPGGPTATPTRTPTPGGTFPVPGTYYRLINRNSGKVAEVANFSTADGGNVQQWTWTGTSSQQWSFVSVGGGYYNVINRNSGKCLDVSGVSTADGANVHQWTCGSGTNQRWQPVAVGSYYQLKVQHSGKALDVSGCGTANGVNIQQWTWLNNNCQQWQIVP